MSIDGAGVGSRDVLDGIGLGGDGAGPRKAEAEAKKRKHNGAVAVMIMSASDDRALMWGKEEGEAACSLALATRRRQRHNSKQHAPHTLFLLFFSSPSLLFLFLFLLILMHGLPTNSLQSTGSTIITYPIIPFHNNIYILLFRPMLHPSPAHTQLLHCTLTRPPPLNLHLLLLLT